MADKKSNHLLLHIGLISFTLLAIYPVLWVLALAFSGQQSVGMIDLPKDPSFFERLRGVLPIPEHLSVKNFVEVWTDQSFGLWLWNSVLGSSRAKVVPWYRSCVCIKRQMKLATLSNSSCKLSSSNGSGTCCLPVRCRVKATVS